MIETTLETELWLSFVSLLRSYAAAANLNLREPAVVEEAGDHVIIAAGTTRLVMRFAAGEVSWERIGTEAAVGSFEFLPEGTIAIHGKVQDLDHVAIEFIASVTHSGKGSGR